jgi:protein-L-isoaspartate(D-aspartate) O-methyltransferase
MAWRCSASSNRELIANLVSAHLLKTPQIIAAMIEVDRAFFIPKSLVPQAYEDSPLPLGFEATISAPHMHAICLELLADKLVEGARVLDVGSGSGYLVAAFALLTRPCARAGLVVGIEHIPELTERSKKNISFALPNESALWGHEHVKLVSQDGRLGWPAGAPFDAIHVGAASPEIPKVLIEQLAPGGRLLIPFGPAGEDQDLLVFERSLCGTAVTRKTAGGVRYVPLCSKTEQLGSQAV